MLKVGFTRCGLAQDFICRSIRPSNLGLLGLLNCGGLAPLSLDCLLLGALSGCDTICLSLKLLAFCLLGSQFQLQCLIGGCRFCIAGFLIGVTLRLGGLIDQCLLTS